MLGTLLSPFCHGAMSYELKPVDPAAQNLDFMLSSLVPKTLSIPKIFRSKSSITASARGKSFQPLGSIAIATLMAEPDQRTRKGMMHGPPLSFGSSSVLLKYVGFPTRSHRSGWTYAPKDGAARTSRIYPTLFSGRIISFILPIQRGSSALLAGMESLLSLFPRQCQQQDHPHLRATWAITVTLGPK